jgi:hypothetical protein
LSQPGAHDTHIREFQFLSGSTTSTSKKWSTNQIIQTVLHHHYSCEILHISYVLDIRLNNVSSLASVGISLIFDAHSGVAFIIYDASLACVCSRPGWVCVHVKRHMPARQTGKRVEMQPRQSSKATSHAPAPPVWVAATICRICAPSDRRNIVYVPGIGRQVIDSSISVMAVGRCENIILGCVVFCTCSVASF